MRSRTNITLFRLLCSGLLLGCADDAVVGASGQLDIDLPQTAVGAFAGDTSTAIADVNGDGFGDLIVWSNAVTMIEDEDVIQNGDVPVWGVYVVFGAEERFATQLDRADADVRLKLPVNTFAARVAVQDLDGDGKSELIVHAAVESTDTFPSVPDSTDHIEGALFVVRGAAITPGVHALASIAEVTPAYAGGEEYVVEGRYELRDLDGVPGEEFLTEPYRAVEVGNTIINVRDVATGETRARLLAPDRGYLDARGVLDHDGDGNMDVAVAYVRIEEGLTGANPNNERVWEEVGLGIFYGPLTGDITLGGPGTGYLPVPLIGLQLVEGFMLGGAAVTVVSDACGDETDDVVVSHMITLCLTGGHRGFVREDLHIASPGARENAWTMVARLEQHEQSHFFMMDYDRLSVVAMSAGAPGSGGASQTLVNLVEFDYWAMPGTPRFTRLGGAMADIDGDGVLDVALGTMHRDPDYLVSDSFVHVIYGFGG